MSNADERALLPCPFCGGSNVDLAKLGENICVQCADCEASGPWTGNGDVARLKWTRRAPPAADPWRNAVSDALVDAMLDALGPDDTPQAAIRGCKHNWSEERAPEWRSVCTKCGLRAQGSCQG